MWFTSIGTGSGCQRGICSNTGVGATSAAAGHTMYKIIHTVYVTYSTYIHTVSYCTSLYHAYASLHAPNPVYVVNKCSSSLENDTFLYCTYIMLCL